MSFWSGKSNPDQAPEVLTIKISECKPEQGGVGLSLNLHNVRAPSAWWGAAVVTRTRALAGAQAPRSSC